MDEKEVKGNIIKEEETINEKEYVNDAGKIIIERTIQKIIYIKDNTKVKDSQRKYYENNKEKVTNYIREYSNERYKNDEEYREKIKQKRRENYAKKKELKKELNK